MDIKKVFTTRIASLIAKPYAKQILIALLALAVVLPITIVGIVHLAKNNDISPETTTPAETTPAKKHAY